METLGLSSKKNNASMSYGPLIGFTKYESEMMLATSN